MKMLKRFLAIALVMCMMLSVVPFSAFANEASTTGNTATISEDDTFQRILHLDCGRKYFTKDWIIALINEMAAAGYNQLQLAFGNDGLRFLLDDMSFAANGTTYAHATVVSKIEAGNSAQNSSGDTRWLTQTEMDEIITHANSKNIEIVPLLNLPGHANAILDIVDNAYNASGSDNTLNVASSSEAQAFGLAIFKKYVDYFAGKSCKYFSFGADEYANDASGSFSFSRLSSTEYAEFVSFISKLTAYIEGKGMTARAFNDGLYYNDMSADIDTDLQCCYWSSGWSGYNLASASTIAGKGHPMINTNGDFYYVLGKTDTWDNNGYTAAANFDITQFSKYTGYSWTTETISDPVGAMFCIWCDYPTAETEAQVAANTRLALRAMAAEMQGNDATAISTEVVVGGFNADGTINEDEAVVKTLVTLTENNVSVTAYDLTSLTVETTAAPTIEGVANVLAWNMTPVTADGKYTGEATVAVPVPEGWDSSKVGGFVVNNDNTITLINGALNVEGNFEFTMPHFSVGGVYENAATAVVEDTVTSNGQTGTAYVLDTDGVIDTDTTYLIVNTGSDGTGYAFTNNGGKVESTNVSISGGAISVTDDSNIAWTFSGSSTGYISNNGYYVSGYDNNLTLLTSTIYTYTFKSAGNGAYKLYVSGKKTRMDYLYWTGSSWGTGYVNNNEGSVPNVYLYAKTTGEAWTVQPALQKSRIAAYTVSNDGYDEESWNAYQAALTAAQEKLASVEATTYASETAANTALNELIAAVDALEAAKNALAKAVDITINYVDENGTTVKTETVQVSEKADSIVLSNFNHNGKFYVVDNATLSITPATVTEYTITVTETEEDLSQVAPLTIEYWITNGRVTDNAYADSTNLNYLSVNAADTGIYSENGVAIDSLVPATATREGRTLVFWQAKLLDTTLTNSSTSGTQEQTETAGDDETLAGSAITHVRYWNGSWQVLTGDTWTAVTDTHHQLVAYYLEIIEIANDNGETELLVNAADWGFASGDNWGYWTGGYTPCTVSIQIVYEDGTTNPGDTTTNTLLTKTLVYAYWDGGRGLGTMIFTGDDYNIYKVTAETGDAAYTNNNNGFTINSFTWDDNEETVWSGDAANSVSIGNPARNPSYESPYDNLAWNTSSYNQNNAILIRVYVKAVATEDSLTVVYYDEKFGDTLYTYNIHVPSGTIFSGDYFDPKPTEFAGNANRIDVYNAGIKNTNGVTQYFQTDLTKVPEAVGKYNSNLYKYTGSEISEDGKTLYLYYNIDTEVLSPNFVADFGLPLTFKLTDVVGAGEQVTVKSVTVTPNTRYGTLSYDSTTSTFTYTPTTVLQNVDVLTISILFDGENAATTTNVGVTPATTVHYEASFLEKLNGWSEVSTSNATQTAEVMGAKKYNFGYEPGYTGGSASTSKAIGSTAEFTFTGTGVDVYANCTDETGYVAVRIKNANTGKTYLVNTVAVDGTSTATNGQTTINNAPIVSVRDLTHGTYTVTITKVINDKEVRISGFRVYNTVKDSTIFAEDLEDNPDFYELRDYVLQAMNVGNSTQYGSLAEMAAQVYAGIGTADEKPSTVILANKTYDLSVQDLLDNGPKNELFLRNGETLVFSVTTERDVQVGLRAPNGETSYKITGAAEETTGSVTSVDMFYDMGVEPGTSKTYTFTITNTGSNILSVTLLKICDDPNAAFEALTQKDIKTALIAMGYADPDPCADGHSYEAVVTAPTCTEAGYTTHTCSVCGDSYTDSETAATGHSYVDKVTKPTETEEGYTTHTCENCGDSYVDSYTPAVPDGSSNTGDNTPTILWTVVLVVSLGGIVLLMLKRKEIFNT